MRTNSPAPDELEAARGYRAALGFIAGAVVADLVVAAWAANTWLAIGRLERDEVQILSVWEPVAWMYAVGGPLAAMAPFALMSMLATVALLGGVLRARELRPYVTREALRRARLADQECVHPFLRQVDETGAIPRRTIVLGAVLALLIAGTTWYVVTGRAERERQRRGLSSSAGGESL